MMRAAVLSVVVALAFAQCNTPTCYKCQNMTGCGWYTAGPLANCFQTTAVPSGLNYTLTAAGKCPACQAGNCSDCQASAGGGCAWYKNSVGIFGGTCASNSTPPSTSVPGASYVLQTTCPPCAGLDCAQCTANENVTSCGWYTLAGVTSGQCAEASPGFLYSKASAGFCNGNPCAGASNCTYCLQANNQSDICSWYVPASNPPFLSSLYNPKCDLAAAGIVDSTLYTAQSQCLPCQDTTCTACQAEGSGCQWLAVNVGSTNLFGQCVVANTQVSGKGVVGTCPAACQLYSCSQCIVVSGCEWFTYANTSGASIIGDVCDRTSDAFTHPAATPITSTSSQKCPACRDTRCYECNQETANNCQWYAQTLLGKIVPGTDACYPMGKNPTLAPTPIPTTDSRCKGNPNSAAVALPGLAFLAAFFA